MFLFLLHVLTVQNANVVFIYSYCMYHVYWQYKMAMLCLLIPTAWTGSTKWQCSVYLFLLHVPCVLAVQNGNVMFIYSYCMYHVYWQYKMAMLCVLIPTAWTGSTKWQCCLYLFLLHVPCVLAVQNGNVLFIYSYCTYWQYKMIIFWLFIPTTCTGSTKWQCFVYSYCMYWKYKMTMCCLFIPTTCTGSIKWQCCVYCSILIRSIKWQKCVHGSRSYRRYKVVYLKIEM